MREEDLDILKFLIEQHIKEVQYFWMRTNIFIVLNVAVFGAVINKVFSETPMSKEVMLIIGVIGITFCGIWIQVSRVSKYYSNRWLTDARRIACDSSALKEGFYISLGFREKEKYYLSDNFNWFEDKFLDLKRPYGLNATRCMFLLIALFSACWFLFIVAVLFNAIPN